MATLFQIEGDLLRTRCVFTAVGNHELHEASGANFLKYFGDDDPNANGLRKLYRTVRWENMRFFFLNGMDEFASSDERKWLDGELAKADAEPNLIWRVVVLHQGVWSSGPHGNNPRLADAGIVDIFRAHKIDLILSGHDHIYERGDAQGMKYIVSGGGGAPLYEIGKKLPSTKKAESTFHFVETKIDGDKLAMTVRRGDGSLLENCGFQKGQPWDCDGPKKLATELAKPSTIPDPGDPQIAQKLDTTDGRSPNRSADAISSAKKPVTALRSWFSALACSCFGRRKRSLRCVNMRTHSIFALARHARAFHFRERMRDLSRRPRTRREGVREANQHEQALAIFRTLETDTGHFDTSERARYFYLRGMTDYRIGYKADARHYLLLASAVETQSPGTLPDDWKQRLNEAVGTLSSQVYDDGIESLGSSKQKCRRRRSDIDNGSRVFEQQQRFARQNSTENEVRRRAVSSRPRILLVDDKAPTRAAVARMLKSKYDVFESDDGQGALLRIKCGERFDLILMDVEMPIVNGPEAFRRIAIMEPDLADRVVFLTGGARDPEIQDWLGRLEPGRLLWKPISANDLRAALERIEAKTARISNRPSSDKMRASKAGRPSVGKIEGSFLRQNSKSGTFEAPQLTNLSYEQAADEAGPRVCRALDRMRGEPAANAQTSGADAREICRRRSSRRTLREIRASCSSAAKHFWRNENGATLPTNSKRCSPRTSPKLRLFFPTAMFDLAVANEGLEERSKARDLYVKVATTYPENAIAHQAWFRVLDLDAFLEDWPALGETAKNMLDRKDLDDVDRMTTLGARGLSEIELGDDVHAGRDVEEGLEIADRLSIGAAARLPASVAQLRFALGEIRRTRSERIHFVPEDANGLVPDALSVPADFLQKMNARCDGLMDAQHAYGEAMRSVDAHWIAMSGFRVGEMYRKLHHDLMVIPPTLLAKSDKQKQIFFAIMHVRYRVLLEKADDMMDRTLSVSAAGLDDSAWISRAKDLKRDIDLAIDEEKAAIKSFPFTEDEIKKAIEILRKKAEDQQAKKK